LILLLAFDFLPCPFSTNENLQILPAWLWKVYKIIVHR
jgi:hypothetical protein